MLSFLRSSLSLRNGIIFICLAAPFVAAFLVFILERHSSIARFHELAEQRILSILFNLDIAESSVDLIANHFSVSDPATTDRGRFRQLVARNLADHRYVQAYSFNPIVALRELRTHEDQTRRAGHPGYVVTERDESGKSGPVSVRDAYVPIQFIEPLETNRAALGFDLASNPDRQRALRNALESGKPRATGRITLDQERSNQYGILLIAPVFEVVQGLEKNGPGPLKGYVSGVFRMGDLVNSTDSGDLNPLLLPLVDIHLIDASNPMKEEFLYPNTDPSTTNQIAPEYQISKSFSFGGSEWRIVAVPSPTFMAMAIPWAAIATLTIALIASGILLLYIEMKVEKAEIATEHAQAMSLAKERLSAAQRIARLATLEFDADRELIDLGDEAEQMLGLVPGAAANLRELLANLDRDHRLDFVDMLFSATASPKQLEITVMDGQEQRTLEAVFRRARVSAPVLVTLQDITLRKREERERSEMLVRVSEAERLSALGTMAGGIAHEINTPVQYIGDNLRFINDQVDGLLKITKEVDQGGKDAKLSLNDSNNFDLEFARQETPSALRQALEGIDQIARIVQAVKEYSHPTNQKFAAVDLNHAVETVVTVTRNQWKYVAELQLDLDPSLPNISAVEGEINQVLVNLIVNASQAIAEKGESSLGHIWVSTRRIEDEVSITVRDDGPGIATDNLKKTFDMFFTTKPPGKGTGQGLALVKSIIHRHGGLISVESEPGSGASFVVRLPIVQNEENSLCLANAED